MLRWKSMKTAPRNGTTILLKVNESFKVTASWQDFSDGEGWYIGYTWNGKHSFVAPIGWLEIPK